MASWQDDLDVARAKHRRDPTSRYAQLATTDADGRPRCRTVVVRTFEPETARLLVATDARSAKVTQLERSRWVELCWYFRKTREQFRLLAQGSILHGDITRKLWASLSPSGRRSFLWPAPGQPRAPSSRFEVDDPAAPPPSFVGLALDVDEVDHLVLGGDPHQRRRFRRADGWQREALNP